MGIFNRIDGSYGGTGHKGSKTAHTSIIAPGTTVNGDIFSEGGVHIGGEVTGSVEAKTYAIVAPSAIIYGSLHAAEVYLSGHVKGDIWALEMEISDAGSCDGAIFAFKINGEFTTK